MLPNMLPYLRTTASNRIRWIVVGQLLDARNKCVLKNAHLIYNQHQILHVGTEVPPVSILNGNKAPDLTLPDYTAMPGLIDGHSHTLTPVQEQVDHAAIMGWEGETLDNLNRILENHARSIQKALALGVDVLVGSDAGSCGVAHGTGLICEMELLEAAGMPTLDILCQVTYGNHRLLINEQPIGSLEKNFKPRFIVTKNNPLETVKNLYLERLVLFDGEAESSSGVSLDRM